MNDSISIQFFGAARCVTGSKYLLRTPGNTTLIDCGLFQGLKELRQRNWEPLPSDPAKIDQVILPHAHIDHTGYLPPCTRRDSMGRSIARPPQRSCSRCFCPTAAT